MNLPTSELYSKIQELSREVKEQLRSKGIIVPVRKKDGTIQVGHYRIKKEVSGFYSIIDFRNETVVDRINLPQTAAILANKLALGKYLDDEIIDADSRYGFALFDETLHRHLAERSLKSNDIDKADMMYTKVSIAKSRKEQFKREVNIGFEKLIRFR